MTIEIGSLLTALHDSTPKYDSLPLFVKKIFRAAGNTVLWSQDDSAAYRIASGERKLSDQQARGIDVRTNLHQLMRHLSIAIPEDSTRDLMTRFGAATCGAVNRQALLYAIANQFFRCVGAANNEAENIIPDYYRNADDHPSIMFDPSDNGSLALFANEVGGFCPLCTPHKKFTYKRDGTPSNFTTIQIFPEGLSGDELASFIAELGEEPESFDSFENRIAVCRDCADHYHSLFGYDLNEAKKLRDIKLKFAATRKGQKEASDAGLSRKINEILDAIRAKKVFDFPDDEDFEITYDPKDVARKIPVDEDLCVKVTMMAVRHYDNIRRHFYYLDKVQEGTFDDVCDEVKKAYRIFSRTYGHQSQEAIFNAMVDWVNQKTFNDESYRTACEIVVSFFVQNCEVFVA